MFIWVVSHVLHVNILTSELFPINKNNSYPLALGRKEGQGCKQIIIALSPILKILVVLKAFC